MFACWAPLPWAPPRQGISNASTPAPPVVAQRGPTHAARHPRLSVLSGRLPRGGPPPPSSRWVRGVGHVRVAPRVSYACAAADGGRTDREPPMLARFNRLCWGWRLWFHLSLQELCQLRGQDELALIGALRLRELREPAVVIRRTIDERAASVVVEGPRRPAHLRVALMGMRAIPMTLEMGRDAPLAPAETPTREVSGSRRELCVRMSLTIMSALATLSAPCPHSLLMSKEEADTGPLRGSNPDCGTTLLSRAPLAGAGASLR